MNSEELANIDHGLWAPSAPTDLSTQYTENSAVILSSTGTDALLSGATSSQAGLFSAADKEILDRLASGAQSGSLNFESIDAVISSNSEANFVRVAGSSIAGDGGGALYVRVDSDPGHAGSFQDSGGAFWELAESKVTPHMFGAKGDRMSDDTASLQSFFDYLTDHPSVLGDFSGEWHVSDTIRIEGEVGSRFVSGKLKAINEIEGSLLEVRGPGLNFDGTLQLEGYWTGTPTIYENRQVESGLTLIGAGRSKFDKIEARGFQRFAVEAEEQGNNNLNLGDIRVIDAGSTGREDGVGSLTAGIVSIQDNGDLGFTQRSIITLDEPVPSEVKRFDLIKIGSSPYLIQEINGNTVSVYPAVSSSDRQTSSSIDYLHGGAVSFETNDAGIAIIESIAAVRVGVALDAGALFGPSVGQFASTASGIGLVVGESATGSGRRITVEGAYFEDNAFNVVHTGGTASSVFIGQAYDPVGVGAQIDFNKLVRLSATIDGETGRSPTFEGITFVTDTIYTPTAQRAFGATNSTERLSNDADQNHFFADRNDVTFELSYLEGADRLYGLNRVEIYAFGDGDNKQPTGTVRVTVSESDESQGITIEGGDFVLQGLEHPAYLIARFDHDLRKWEITWDELAPASTSQMAVANDDPTSNEELREEVDALKNVLIEHGLIESERLSSDYDQNTEIHDGVGTHGDDVLVGTLVLNEIRGAAGSDSIFGASGDDTLYGGNGNDKAIGDAGNDVIYGGRNADELFGGSGLDLLLGQHGPDHLFGGDGHDTLEGGRNADALFGGNENDRLLGDHGFDRLFGGASSDTIEGGRNADELYGGSGDDQLLGGHGLDRLFGGEGNDALNGGTASDVLDGGSGNDRLTGGNGTDLFVFRGSNFGNDVVADKSEQERLDLSSYSDLGFSDLLILQDGSDALVSTDYGSIRLLGVEVSSLMEDDFLLS